MSPVWLASGGDGCPAKPSLAGPSPHLLQYPTTSLSTLSTFFASEHSTGHCTLFLIRFPLPASLRRDITGRTGKVWCLIHAAAVAPPLGRRSDAFFIVVSLSFHSRLLVLLLVSPPSELQSRRHHTTDLGQEGTAQRTSLDSARLEEVLRVLSNLASNLAHAGIIADSLGPAAAAATATGEEGNLVPPPCSFQAFLFLIAAPSSVLNSLESFLRISLQRVPPHSSSCSHYNNSSNTKSHSSRPVCSSGACSPSWTPSLLMATSSAFSTSEVAPSSDLLHRPFTLTTSNQ